MRAIAAILLAVLLAGCSWVGGGPDEAERAAARLAEPPDVLADAMARPAGGGGGDAAEQRGDAVEVVRSAAMSDPAAELSRVDGMPVLDLGLPPNAGWAVVGRALERSGFELVGSDRRESMHMIRYDSGLAGEAEPAEADGLFASLAFWREEARSAPSDFRVVVVERGKGTRVSLQTSAGEPAPRGASRQVLGVLAEQLKP